MISINSIADTPYSHLLYWITNSIRNVCDIRWKWKIEGLNDRDDLKVTYENLD